MKEFQTLENAWTRLLPLTMENYHVLKPVASEPGLVRFSPSTIETPESLKNYVEIALEEFRKGESVPYIIYDKKSQRYAGCTRFMNIDRINKVLHIGSTWIGKEFQGTGLNSGVKRLMLDHAFNTRGFEKVEFRIDERNVRSRRAVEKLGAVLEGILRRNVYLTDGYKRNTCCYGIFREEWELAKAGSSEASG